MGNSDGGAAPHCPQKMVIYSVIGGLLSVVLGLFSSLELNTSSGPSIIVASLILFILSLKLFSASPFQY